MPLRGEYIDPLPPTTFQQVLDGVNVSSRLVLQLTAGINMKTWFPVTGYAYLHPLGDGSGIYNSSVDLITAVYVNGQALTAGASQDDVVNNQGYFFWDGVANQALLISLPDTFTGGPQQPNVTVEAIATFYFSDGPSDANGVRWDDRITSWASLSRQITPDFSSIPQIGGGSITFANEDHYFDQRFGYNWDAGQAVLIMGASGLPWDQWAQLGIWAVASPKLDDGRFTLNVQDPKVLVDTLFPQQLYSLDEYPDLDPSSVGAPLQIAYGQILGAVPVLIDNIVGIFQVAGHPIYSFDGVRVQAGDGTWVPVNFDPTYTDTALAQFAIESGYWAPGQSVVVDFSGRMNTDGSLMSNPADQIQDLLAQLGQPVNSAGFAAAHAWYDIGYYFGTTTRAVACPTAVYIDTQGQAITTLQNMAVNIRAYIQTAADGGFTLTPFRSFALPSIPTITDQDILTPGVDADGSGTTSTYVQAGTKISQVVVNYGIKSAEQKVSQVTVQLASSAYTRMKILPDGSPNWVQEVVDSLFNDIESATNLGYGILLQDQVDQFFVNVKLKWIAWNWFPGGGVRVKSDRLCLDLVMEVIKVVLDPNTRTVNVQLGNLRGFENSFGFWTDDDVLTPLGNSLDWPQQGQVNDPDGETQVRRLTCGHWLQDASADCAVDTTNPANRWSDLDVAVSRWSA